MSVGGRRTTALLQAAWFERHLLVAGRRSGLSACAVWARRGRHRSDRPVNAGRLQLYLSVFALRHQRLIKEGIAMDWKVRYIDYGQQYQKIRSEVLATIDTVLSQGDLMLRQQLRDFEANLAAFVGTRYAVGTSNCTDALHLVLRAAGIGPGAEVITVSHTFVATAAAIHHAGATPVLVDIADDHNMN